MNLKLELLIIIALITASAFIKAIIASSNNKKIWPFYAKKLLSQPEQILYFRLLEALPNHIILAQVQLSQLLGVKKGNNHQSWLNRINRMSVDFVVCNKDSSIVAAIELDDSTHLRKNRKTADAKKDKALNSANVRVIRWHVKSIPDISTIQTNITPPTLPIESNLITDENNGFQAVG